jgi:small subunit ribosomal protein S9
MADEEKTEQGDVQEPQAAASEQAPEAAEAPEQPAEAPEQPAEAPEQPVEASADEVVVEGDAVVTDEDLEEDVVEETPTPRVKPEIPGADLEVDLVRDGDGERPSYYSEEDDEAEGGEESDVEDLTQPIADASIDLAAAARYRATGKRKSAIARVTLRPGTGAYVVNGRTLEQHFPRAALQRTIRQPLETVAYETRIDVIASIQGGGVSAQAGALRHGISRALIEAAPTLRVELKRRGFLTRDPRVKERKKAGLKKARKRPQFSKR